MIIFIYFLFTCPGFCIAFRLHVRCVGHLRGPSKVRRVLQESALRDVFVVVLDDTGRSENEKMNMTVLNASCQPAITIYHVLFSSHKWIGI